MTQVALPISDVLTGNWTPTPIYPEIDTPAPPDSTSVSSGLDPAGDTFEVKLSPLGWPGGGPQIVKVRLKCLTATIVAATILLLQAGSTIAALSVEPTTTFTTYALELSDAEKRLITDYTDLRVRVVAGSGVVSG